MDNNQTIAACMTAKVPFTTTKGIELVFHFFSFPLEAKVKNRWPLAINRQEHRDGFIVTEYTKVCEHHFRPEEIRKDLKDKTIISSMFSWNKSGYTFARKSPRRGVFKNVLGKKKTLSLNQNHLI